MEHLIELQAPWWEYVLRGAVVYLAVLLLIRLSGKRTVGEFTPFDLIVVVLLGESMQGALVPSGPSILGPLLVAATLVGLNWLLAFATARSRRLDALVEGDPVVLVRNGRFVASALKSQNVPESDVMEAIRGASLERVEDVRLATLETDGDITIVPQRKT